MMNLIRRGPLNSRDCLFATVALVFLTVPLAVAAAPLARHADPSAPSLKVKSKTYGTAGPPFEALPSPAGDVFVSVLRGIQVFRPDGHGHLRASCVEPLPAELIEEGAGLFNLAWLPGGKEIAAGAGSRGALFYDAAALATCSAVGVNIPEGPARGHQGALAVAVTPDRRYAFIANEYGVAPGAFARGNVGVVKLVEDDKGEIAAGSALIGQMATGGMAIAGMTLSPDGKRLYVTSEVVGRGTRAAGESNKILTHFGCTQRPGSNMPNGLLTVFDVAKAEAAPGPGAIVNTVNAGCSPVRMAETRDERTLWVAARGDDRVLAFDTAKLESDPDHALIGYASSGGTAPVGVALFGGEKFLAVANSARFGGGRANAAILDVEDPAHARLVRTVGADQFPREIWVGPDDWTLYLTNFLSRDLQVIETSLQ